MADSPQLSGYPAFSGVSASGLGTILVAGGWTRDAGPPGVVRLTTSTDQVGIGTTSPLAGSRLEVAQDDASNATFTDVEVVTHTTSGAPTAGIGAALLLRAEGSSGTQNAARLVGVLTNVGAGTEAGALDIYTRTAGAALSAAWRFTGTGNLVPTPTSTSALFSAGRGATANDQTTYAVSGVTITGIVNVHSEDSTGLVEDIIFDRHSNAVDTGATLVGLRSRGTHAAPTIVNNGDLLWRLAVGGWDGAKYSLAAYVSAEVDGTPGVSDMPGRLIFYTTPDGSGTPTERWRITNSGTLQPGSNGLPLGTTALRPDIFIRGWNTSSRRVTAAGADNVTATDGVAIYNATLGNQTPTLPDLTVNPGMHVYVAREAADVSGNTVVVTPQGGQTIGGSATRSLAANQTLHLFAPAAGTDWTIL